MTGSGLEPLEAMRLGIEAARKADYLRALTLLNEAYSADQVPAPDGLSHFGLCVALVQKTYKPAVELCKKAVELQFYNAEHYANLARVYVAADHRKKALSTIEQGLKMVPDDQSLLAVRKELGLRRKPPIPFLSRSNPLNVAMGRQRHLKEEAAKEKAREAVREAKARDKAKRT